MIKIERVSKIYKTGSVDFYALKDLSLEIKKGDFIAITGHSGCGKTTLLNLIGLLDTQTSGNIYINGQDLGALSEIERARFRNKNLGFVFQSFYLEPNYTVFKSVEMPLIIGGVPKKERARLVDKALETVNILPKAQNKTSTLSGGEKQRTAIARAIVSNPDIILADEPCGNLDTVNSKNILETLIKLNKEGKTIILVTHNPEEAAIGRYIIRLKDGHIDEA